MAGTTWKPVWNSPRVVRPQIGGGMGEVLGELGLFGVGRGVRERLEERGWAVGPFHFTTHRLNLCPAFIESALLINEK